MSVELTDLQYHVRADAIRKAVQDAADAFAQSLSATALPHDDWSAEVAVSSSEARAQANLAEAWTLIVDAIEVAHEFQRSTPDGDDLKWQVKDHITALQQIVTDMSAKRKAWMDELLAKYRPKVEDVSK